MALALLSTSPSAISVGISSSATAKYKPSPPTGQHAWRKRLPPCPDHLPEIIDPLQQHPLKVNQ